MPRRTPSLPKKTNGKAYANASFQPSASELITALLDQVNKNRSAVLKEAGRVWVDPYSIVGTLPDWAIRQYIKDGVIKIDPLPEDWKENIDEVTLDFHLGNVLRVFRPGGLNLVDPRFTTKEEMEAMMDTIVLKPGQPFILTEEDFVIATTRERLILPDNIIGHLNGKSSLARLGVVIHSTAARFDPGWDGCPVLEFGTFLKGKKIVIYEGSPICAFSFEKMAQPVERSYTNRLTSKYWGSSVPEVSNIMGRRGK